MWRIVERIEEMCCVVPQIWVYSKIFLQKTFCLQQQQATIKQCVVQV